MTYVGQVSREDVTRPSVSVAEQEFPPQFLTDTDTRRRGDFGLARLLLHRLQTLDSATDNYAQTAVGLISTCRFSLLFFQIITGFGVGRRLWEHPVPIASDFFSMHSCMTNNNGRSVVLISSRRF